ncbi:MAG: M90 family metallopeptidase [Nitrospirota bacterium]|nr:M90 family metallopeptidase [Nitrospirota bacterium]
MLIGPVFYILGLIALVMVFIAAGKYLRNARRQRLMKQPFPREWEEILRKNVALYKYLPGKFREPLHGYINVFLNEKKFEGCGGLQLTDVIKVTIAAQACLLLLKGNPTFYPRLKSILVYPGAYVAKQTSFIGSIPVQMDSARLGESWTRGDLVLAWDHVKQESVDIGYGHNVVLHEFSHQLDQEDGSADGAPILDQVSSYVAWARILGREYGELVDMKKKHHKDVIDAYGATNPAEFFAVITEAFFTKSAKLHKKHPELYEELKLYYKMDPLKWVSQSDLQP